MSDDERKSPYGIWQKPLAWIGIIVFLVIVPIAIVSCAVEMWM